MKTILSRIKFRLLCFKLIVLLSLPVIAIAQIDSPQALIRIFEIDVRPSAILEWSRMQKEELIPIQLEGGLESVDVWRVAGTGNPYSRHIVVPLTEISELDEISPFEKVLGPEAATTLLDQHRSLVERIETKIAVPRLDLGFGETPETPSIGVLSTVTVASGRTQEFEEHLKTTVARDLRNSLIPSFWVGQILFGTEINQYITFVNFEDFGDSSSSAHPTALSWALGSVGVAKLANQENSPITSIKRTVLRYDTDLSAEATNDSN